MNLNELTTKVNVPGKLVLVDFMAEWCGPCKALAPVLDTLIKGNNVDLVKVDVDDDAELADGFSIRSVPTLILFKDGKEVDRVMGLTPRAKLQELLDKHK